MNNYSNRKTCRMPVRSCYMILGLLFSMAAFASAAFTYFTGEPKISEAVKSGNLWILLAVGVSHLPMLGVTSLFSSVAFWMFRKMFYFDSESKGPTTRGSAAEPSG